MADGHYLIKKAPVWSFFYATKQSLKIFIPLMICNDNHSHINMRT